MEMESGLVVPGWRGGDGGSSDRGSGREVLGDRAACAPVAVVLQKSQGNETMQRRAHALCRRQLPGCDTVQRATKVS